MSSQSATLDQQPVRSTIPARMDRLPWTRFHWSVVVGLGVSWILDGLEIQLVAANGYADTLHMDAGQVGLTGTIYLIGQVVGAFYFGRLTDRLGRKRLFILTLAIYLVGSGIAGLSPNYWFLWVFRFIAGLGIGGEYTAINSAIDELIPAHYRGRVDIAINGTYWGGALLGAAANFYLLEPSRIGWGWRVGFFIGPFLGLIIIYLRRHIPESPRWLLTHGQSEAAQRTVEDIEHRVESTGVTLEPVPEEKGILVKGSEQVPFRRVAEVFIKQYPKRTVLGITMMVTQSFLYNAIFFSYALVLENFYGISKSQTSVYFLPFAVGNLLGPLLLGHLFDTWGRRKMIAGTYTVAGLVLMVSAFLFRQDVLTATTQTIFWCVAFFFASAGASSAYLTVSEIFPLEVRAQAISYFFAIAQTCGGLAPLIYGLLVGDGKDRIPLFWGYVLGAVIMIVGGAVAWFLGINAERKGLEDIADPLSKVTEGEAA